MCILRTMKLKHPVILGVLWVVGLLVFVGTSLWMGNTKPKRDDVIVMKIEGKEYHLLHARTPAEHMRGLMNVRVEDVDGYDGMAFFFDEANSRRFWNMNTLMDLDVVWMHDEKVVGKSFLPSIEKSKEIVVAQSPKPANIAVELIRR